MNFGRPKKGWSVCEKHTDRTCYFNAKTKVHTDEKPPAGSCYFAGSVATLEKCVEIFVRGAHRWDVKHGTGAIFDEVCKKEGCQNGFIPPSGAGWTRLPNALIPLYKNKKGQIVTATECSRCKGTGQVKRGSNPDPVNPSRTTAKSVFCSVATPLKVVATVASLLG